MDPTGQRKFIKGKVKNESEPQCFPGGSPTLGGARIVGFFHVPAGNTSPYFNNYVVPITVPKNADVVFSILNDQNGIKDMTQVVVKVIDNGTTLYSGLPTGPTQMLLRGGN
ncbi:MAG: hypothetical protein HQK98_02650 [Nitrospirae bacterium]|nr:hypothetical protein [Nitrospirota bacterium]